VPDVGDDVKPRRRYRSERRREQAEQTRQRVLDAAYTLFDERGYEAATIAAIAAEAGVSAETVYARFDNKRTLFGELMQRAVRGEDSAPVPEQSGPRALAALSDQREQLRRFAADIVLRIERAGPMMAVLAGAPRTDPELAELLARLQADRLRNLGILVDAVAANGPLRLDRDQAVETVWALASPDVHRLLTQIRGWTRERYCDWLSETLAAVLLPA
jgi:AcrR family transcriptional regulator